MNRFAWRAVAAMLLVLASCTDAPEAVIETTGGSARGAADELIVTCTKDETQINSSTVRATSAGVRLNVADESGGDLQVRTEHEDGLGGIYAEEGAATVGLPPGKSYVLCSERDGPEHMVAPSESSEAATVVVEADATAWRSPAADCQLTPGMVADFGGPTDPNAPQADESAAEATVRAHFDWMQPSDVVERAGYRDGAGPVTYRIQRDGHTVATANLTSMDGKWVILGSGECAEVRTGGDDAVWFISPEAEPDQSAETFEVDVMRVGCNGGVTGKVMEPSVDIADERITVTFSVEPVLGGDCPGNDRVPYTVVVGEPIGDRELFDGGCHVGMQGAQTTWCIDNNPVRWPRR
jgi:hypothetical protein